MINIVPWMFSLYSKIFVSILKLQTFDLDVSKQHRLDLFAPDQDASGPPVQDVHTRLQTHLEAATDTGSGEDSFKLGPPTGETLPRGGTHRVCSPLAVVGDFDPLLVVALHHLLTLLVLDLDTRSRGHGWSHDNPFPPPPTSYVELEEDVVVGILVGEGDRTLLLQVDGVDQGHGALVSVGL